MTWVKICGMTNLEDALVAADAGADAVGFVFHPDSPRNVDPQTAANIAAKLPKQTEKVGIFVADRIGGIAAKKRIAHQVHLTAIQAYGYTSHASLQRLGELSAISEKLFVAWPADRFLKGRLGGSKWRSEAKNIVSAIFLDSGSSQQQGGTGRSFDWNQAAGVLSALAEGWKFVVAGGLTAENVAEAIQILRPWGVDVASGVEASPGKKDPEKVRAFVRAVREYDRKVS